MKYLFIFLPFFAFGQDTIVRGPDTMIIGRSYYHNPSFYKEWARVGKHKDTPGGDSTLYGVRFDSIITHDNFLATPNSSGFLADRFELYYSDRKPKVVESFKYLGAYYELRENGWYKEILPDTIPDFTKENLKSENGVVFRWVEEPKWMPCDQQFGEVDHPKRDKIDQSEVNILVWTGCSLAEYKTTKFIGYNYGDNSFYADDNVRLKDVVIWYLAGDKWIKPSHVIKEL